MATRIQKRIKQEHDADIKNSLKNDLKIVKAQIGNQVLDMPEDQKLVFPPVKITHYSATNTPVPKIPVKRIQSSSKSVILDFSDDELAAKFDSFLEQRNKQRNTKSNINQKSKKSTRSGKIKKKKNEKKYI